MAETTWNDFEEMDTAPDAGGNNPLDVPLTLPVSKLDADQYSAEDLNGVTESLFGSGNMAYASLQASQTDALMLDTTGAQFNAGTIDIASAGMPVLNTDRPIAGHAGNTGLSAGQEGSFTHSAIGSIGASALSSDTGTFSPSSNLNLAPESFFRGATTSHNGGTQTTTTSTANQSGSFHQSGNTATTTNSAQTTVHNTTTTTQTTVINEGDTIHNHTDGDIIDNTTTIINNTTNHVTDIINNTTNNVTEVVNNVTENVTEIVNNVTEIVTNITNNITDIVTNITEVVTNVSDVVTNITNNLTEIVNNVTDNLTNIINQLLDGTLSLHLDLDILDTLLTHLQLTIDDSIAGNLSVGAVTGNITTIIGDITNLDVPLIGDLLIDLNFDLLGGGNVDDGYDITIGGFEVPLDLDFLEDIIGDIDLNIALPPELLDPSLLVDSILTTVNSLDNLELASINDILGILGDQGIDGALEIILGQTGLGESFDISLEDVTGGLTDVLDDVVAGAGDLLGGLSGGMTDGLTAPLEGVLDTAAEAINDIAGHLLSGDLDLGTLGDVVDAVTALAGDALDGLSGGLSGDVTDALEGGIDQVTDALDSITDGLLNNELEDAGALIEETLGTVGDVLDALTGGASAPITDGLSDLGDHLGDHLGGGLFGGTGDIGGLTGAIDTITGGLGDALDGLSGGASGGLTEALENAVDGMTDMLDNALGGLAGFADDLISNPFGQILGGGNHNGTDSDITADLGVDILEHTLIDNGLDLAIDPVEDLIGDLDLNLGLNTDLLNGNLLGGNNGADDPNDTDITLETGMDVVDLALANITEHIPLDPLEQLVGDIDLDLGLGINLLGDLADPIVNNGAGGTGEDTLLADIGDTLGDVVSGVTGEILGDHHDLGGVTDLLDGLTGGATTPITDALNDGLEEILNDTPILGGNGLTHDLSADVIDDMVADIGDALDDVTGGMSADITDALEGGVDQVTDLVDEAIEHLLGDGAITDLLADITGGMDIGDGLALLNGDASGGLGDVLGGGLLGGGGLDGLLDPGADAGSWTETVIGDAGGLFGDLLGGGMGGGQACGLPDPIGGIAEGLGLLEIGNNSGHGGGGLFGGLFG